MTGATWKRFATRWSTNFRESTMRVLASMLRNDYVVGLSLTPPSCRRFSFVCRVLRSKWSLNCALVIFGRVSREHIQTMGKLVSCENGEIPRFGWRGCIFVFFGGTSILGRGLHPVLPVSVWNVDERFCIDGCQFVNTGFARCVRTVTLGWKFRIYNKYCDVTFFFFRNRVTITMIWGAHVTVRK